MKSKFDKERLKQVFSFYYGIWGNLGIKEEYSATLLKDTRKVMNASKNDYSNWEERGLPFDRDDFEHLWSALETALELFMAKAYISEEDKAAVLCSWEEHKKSIRRELDYYVGEASGKVPLMASLKEKVMSLSVVAANRLGKYFDLLCTLGDDDVIVLGILVSGAGESTRALKEAIQQAEKRSSGELLKSMMNTPVLMKELAVWQEIRNSKGVTLSGNKATQEIWEKKFFRKANELNTHSLHLLLTAIEYIWPDEQGVCSLDPAQIDQLLLFKYALTAKGRCDVIIAVSFLYEIEDY